MCVRKEPCKGHSFSESSRLRPLRHVAADEYVTLIKEEPAKTNLSNVEVCYLGYSE